MANEQENGVNYAQLQKAYTARPAFRAVIDYLGERERQPREGKTRAGTLQKAVAGNFTIDEVSEILSELANAGCGQVQNGRPKENTRLTWTVNAIETANAIKRSHGETGAAMTSKVEGEEEEFETHLFPVRKSVTMPLRIRKDLTYDEIL